MYKIPLFDLNFDDREISAVTETIKNKWISMGPKCTELEEKFCSMWNAKHALSVTNCTVALHEAIVALGIGKDDEVIVPSLTFVATVNAVRYVGAIPVFADISSLDNLTISHLDIEKKITHKTKAIIVVHYAGFPAEMDSIMAIAKKYGLVVVEDACHGPLSEYKGKKLGTIGDIGCFSFFSNKNISTGEGGMIVTNNSNLYEKMKLLRSHGMTTMSYQRASGHATSYDVLSLGYNYRMDDIRASIGIVQLEKLTDDLIKRAQIRLWYIELLNKIPGIILPFYDNNEFVSNYIFPIVLKDSNSEIRDNIRNRLHQAGIQTSVHYPAIHRFTIYNDNKNDLPLTEYIADNEITLPMHSNLTIEQIMIISKVLKEIVPGVLHV